MGRRVSTEISCLFCRYTTTSNQIYRVEIYILGDGPNTIFIRKSIKRKYFFFLGTEYKCFENENKNNINRKIDTFDYIYIKKTI